METLQCPKCKSDHIYIKESMFTTLYICNECGYISKHTHGTCPRCGSEDVDYANRIIGYLKRVSAFSAARQIEADNRAYNRVND